MNFRLFMLIHNERPYKRYYYQPLVNDTFLGRLKQEIKSFLSRYAAACYLPFNKKYNTPQYNGVRKSKFKMLFENLVWTFKYKEVCNYYFLYGLDLKSRSPKDYVAYTEFRVLRNILNFRIRETERTLYTFNYLVLARDKFVFSQYCKSFNMPYPKTLSLISKGKWGILENDNFKFVHINNILSLNIDAFCKEVTGESGKGAFCLKINDGKILINDKESCLSDLIDKVGNANYIVQERLKNHPQIDKIYPLSLNTLKLITFLKDDGEVIFYDGVMRFGAGGNLVDNASGGGVFVGIDENGCLQDVGYHEPTKSKNLVVNGFHPDTGEKFGGMKLPYWIELLETAKRFHSFFYGIPSIGWDVAFTPNGFVFTETGEDWEIPVYQVTHGGQRKKYYQYHGKALEVKLRKYL